ncbi:hypothetical protein L5C25_32770 [Pseudomonas aeruginosa]|nr:hypothetical protein [Pseudomonas aeruginosa]
MQIREQGRKIQCIRTVYDKAIGRGRQTVIATLARYTGSFQKTESMVTPVFATPILTTSWLA